MIVVLTVALASVINLPHHSTDIKRPNAETTSSSSSEPFILPFQFPPFEIDIGNEIKNLTMVLAELCQEVYQTISEKVKIIEGYGISITTELYGNIQQRSQVQQEEYQKTMSATNALLRKAASSHHHSKSSLSSSIYDTEVSDAITFGHQYAEMGEEKWDYLGEQDNIKVWRCKSPLQYPNTKGSEYWPCVKASAIIDAPPQALSKLLWDSSRVSLVNRYSSGRTDIDNLNQNTKVVWNRSRIPYMTRPFDFCSLMHRYIDPSDNSCVMVTRATQHDKVPRHQDHVRSDAFLGVSIVKPCPNEPHKSEITSINHIRYGGIPPFLVNKYSFGPSINYHKQLNHIAKELK